MSDRRQSCGKSLLLAGVFRRLCCTALLVLGPGPGPSGDVGHAVDTSLRAEPPVCPCLAERNRMARDIHDTLAQGFSGVIVQLEAAAGRADPGLSTEAENHVRRASELARDNLKEARRSVRALRPQALEDKDLGKALEELIQQTNSSTTHARKIRAARPVASASVRLGGEPAAHRAGSSDQRVAARLRHRIQNPTGFCPGRDSARTARQRARL